MIALISPSSLHRLEFVRILLWCEWLLLPLRPLPSHGDYTAHCHDTQANFFLHLLCLNRAIHKMIRRLKLMIVKFDTLNELWIVFIKRGHAFVIFFGASLQLFNTPWLGEYSVVVVFLNAKWYTNFGCGNFFFYLGIFDCVFFYLAIAVGRYCFVGRWLTMKGGGAENEIEATPKNFHYWPMRRMDLYSSSIERLSCAVLRIISIIVHHIPINECRHSHRDLSLYVSISVVRCLKGGGISVALLSNEHLINPNLLSPAPRVTHCIS